MARSAGMGVKGGVPHVVRLAGGGRAFEEVRAMWCGDATEMVGKRKPNRDLVSETVTGRTGMDLWKSEAIRPDPDFDENCCVSNEPAGPFRSHHVALHNRNEDWFWVICLGAARSGCDYLYCVLWVADIDVYFDCLLGMCMCSLY